MLLEDQHSAFVSPPLVAQQTQVTYGRIPSPPGTEPTGPHRTKLPVSTGFLLICASTARFIDTIVLSHYPTIKAHAFPFATSPCQRFRAASYVLQNLPSTCHMCRPPDACSEPSYPLGANFDIDSRLEGRAPLPLYGARLAGSIRLQNNLRV